MVGIARHASFANFAKARRAGRKIAAVLPLRPNGERQTAGPGQIRPWQCLNFFPEPHGQVALRGVPAQGARGAGSRSPELSEARPRPLLPAEPLPRWVARGPRDVRPRASPFGERP